MIDPREIAQACEDAIEEFAERPSLDEVVAVLGALTRCLREAWIQPESDWPGAKHQARLIIPLDKWESP